MSFMQNFCTLYIVRHGETEWNVKKIIQGNEDIPLNKKGESQAKELAKKLRHIKFDVIFSSDLIRAKRTAEIINIEKKLIVQTTKALKERYFGKYQGKSFAVNNEMIKLINNLKMFTGPGLKEVETDESIILRLTTFLREIAVAYSNKTVLIVSHGGPMRTLLIHLGFANYDNFTEGHINNLAYIKLKSDGVEFFVEETKGIKIKKSS
ncbi:phosphoglycerate mutase [Candidatus Roizmanbacteria bacterium CG_4_9_14_3_um_filter_33_18]|uniref:Phosphoglycerate mutase n=2 Tax=Candidatus Roizmaniibacteriota TaxID=1752723 RepID=A0A2M7XZB7_9BACT|nr:MAG: phosphoglycerate mutase [Candidatus Roizmanbacteria bacterium CG22_combo_CG10-13_8_21_14_all_34_12]PJA56056.1 MAG: phosphoglycerate mutase [Candidatus Roizmanbacteria bacterium CG_4_9_14_3_um_filter_33_18]